MNKLLFVVLLGVAGYVAHQQGYSLLPKEGAFDQDGNPVARLFVGPGCGQPCNDVEAVLHSRGIAFERVDVSTPEGQAHGIHSYPLLMVGEGQVLGNRRERIVSLLAEGYGPQVLTAGERHAMRGHFDAAGRPQVVLYGTDWCGYCKRQRAFFADQGIAFSDVDVEHSAEGKTAYDALGGAGYPLVYVGYRRFEGYMEDEIEDAVAELM